MSSSPMESPTENRGVKQDLTDLKQTLTRHFRGVASFLAPPPDHTTPDDDVAGSNGENALAGFAKMASGFLQLGRDEEEREREGDDVAVGVSEEVVAFVRDVSMHHETWLNFPLPDEEDDEEDGDDFDLSDAQQEHALAVERLAPELADLRFALCPSYMSESCFWKIYFVLLHPKLDKNDALVLSTPQILKARAFLTAELRNRPKPKATQDDSDKTTTGNDISVPSESHSDSTGTDIEIEKHSIESTQVPIVDKSVIEQGPLSPVKAQHSNSVSSSKVLLEKDNDDCDDWLKEEDAELAGTVKSTVHIADDEDVSFSDLEED